jgi:predicted nucleic acid-binding OB-fold protein
MSKLLKNNIPQLQFIAGIKNKKLREKILKEKSSDEKLFSSLKEIVENTLRKKLPIKPRTKKLLQRHKNKFKKFIKPTISKRSRKTLLSQSGGYLPILIPLVVSFLSSILSKNE